MARRAPSVGALRNHRWKAFFRDNDYSLLAMPRAVALKLYSSDGDLPPSLGIRNSNATTSELTLSLASLPEALSSTPATVCCAPASPPHSLTARYPPAPR